MENKKLEISKIKDQNEKLDVQGQGCWDDCGRFENNTSTPKCTYVVDARNSILL